MQARVGDIVGSYEIVGLLGQGGMATVYKAYHARLRRHVALKMIHAGLVEDPQFVLRFEREAQIIAALDHPHIVPVYDYAEYNGQPYLVMKFVEGQTLKQYTAKNAVDAQSVLSLMQPIASALDYAHGQGVLHRDVKPSNILLDAQTTAYLTDFGLARLFENADSTISQSMLLGTPAYMSPEQAQGGVSVDYHSDLYSFGVVLYEMIVGQVPFTSGTPHVVIHDQIYRELPAPREMNPNVPERVETVLLKALDKRPEMRYASANELMDALREGFTQNPDAGAQQATPAKPPIQAAELPDAPVSQTVVIKKKPRRQWLVFGCLALVIFAVIFALLFFRQLRELRLLRTATAEITVQVTSVEPLLYEVASLTLEDASANLRLNPQNAQAYLQLAQAQFEVGDQAVALGTLTNGADYADDLLRYSLTAAALALQHNDINTAYLFSAAGLDHAAGTERENAARVWVGEQLYQAAEGEMPNVLLLRRMAGEWGIPVTPMLEALAANSLLAHNRLPAAIAAVDAALSENPSMAEVLLINGEVLAARGNSDAAHQNWQLAHDQPDAPDWVRARARTLLATGTA